MLSRPDVGTKDHIQLWLGTKDASEPYEWLSGDCPAGQYSKQFGDERTGLNEQWLNDLARTTWPHTFGALYQRAVMELE
jgi:hypothetical protein